MIHSFYTAFFNDLVKLMILKGFGKCDNNIAKMLFGDY
jgi:hypothetical protein